MDTHRCLPMGGKLGAESCLVTAEALQLVSDSTLCEQSDILLI